MARRKRLNKRMVILLASIGVVLAVAAAVIMIARQPKDPQVYATRAAGFLEAGRYSEAVDNYGDAAGAAPDGDKPKYLLALAEAMLEWRRKDDSLGQSTRYTLFSDARGALQKALRYNPRFVEARRLLTDLEYGMYLYRLNPDYQQCIVAVNALLALVPKDHKALHMRALAEARLAQTRPEYFESALEDFRTLVKLAPDQEDYWLGLANLQRQGEGADRLEQVEKTYTDALKANPKSVKIRVAYAMFLRRQNRKDDAFKVLVEAVRQQPDKADAYLALASYYQQEGDIDKSVVALETSVKADPTDFRSYTALARIHTARKAPEKAEAVLTEGLKAIRKIEKTDPKGAELQKYRNGIVALNHQLCDALLDRPAEGAAKEKNLQRAKDALKEMRAVAAGSPYVAKIEGRLALSEGRLHEAEKLLRKAYDSFLPRLEPKTAELLINLYRRLGEPGEAQEILKRYLRISRENPAASMALVKLYIDSGQYEDATRLLNTVLRRDRSEEALSLKAALDAVTGQSDRIPAGLAKLDPYAVRLFLRRGRQLWLEGKQEAAVRLVSDVAAKEPMNLAAIVYLLQWHRIRNETTQAGKVLARAKELFKDNPSVLEQLIALMEGDRDKLLARQLALAAKEPDPVRRALRTASIYRSFGQQEKYLEHLAAAEAKDPKNPSVIRQRFEQAISKSDWKSAEKYAKTAAEINLDAVGGRMYRARLAAVRQQLDEAIRLVQEALRIRPRFSQAHSFLGDCYLGTGRIDQARQEFETAYDQNPSNVSALLGLIRISAAAGNADEYARWVELAYKLAPQNPLIREPYIRLREAREDPEKVIAQREQIRKNQPNNLINLSRLAVLYERTGRLPQAEQTYRAIVRISNSNPAAIQALANFLRRRNRDVEARSMLADYAEKATDKVVAFLLWAGYLDAAGDTDQAKTVFLKAIAADPADERGYLEMARFAARHRQWSEAARYQQEYLTRAGENASPFAHRDLIAYLIDAGQLRDAEQKITGILEKDRANVEMLTLEGLVHIKRKDYAKAEEVLDRVLRIRPDYVPALVYRADVHRANRNKAKEIADLEAARRAGAPLAIVVRLANRYDSIGNLENARTTLQSLLADYPRHPLVLKALAGLHRRHGRWTALQEVLETGKKAYPKDPFYPLVEADMWRLRNDSAKAVAALEAALKLVPDNVGVALLRMEAMVEAERYDEAISAGQGLRNHKDIGPQVVAVTGLAYAKHNQQAAAEREFAAAIKAAKPGRQLIFVLNQVISAYPPDKAVEKLKLWSGLRPDDVQMQQVLGEFLLARGDIQGAKEYLNKALADARTDRERVGVLRNLGLVYLRLGQHDESLRTYQAVLKINPDDARTLNNLAWLLAVGLKKPDQALPHAVRAAEMMPNNASVLDTYGYVLLLKGNYDEAQKVLNRSVDIQTMPANRLHLGELYEKMNKKDEALLQYRLGWELVKGDPKNLYYQELRKAFERLGGVPGRST